MELPRLLAPCSPTNCVPGLVWGPVISDANTGAETPRHCLAPTRIGQFAHLLPPLELWAVSRAHSPEPNPHSPDA